jgi:hypothetical protein
MPSKEIKELRQSGKLKEAYEMAKQELDSDPTNIWSKRNISWVYYEFLKQNCSATKFNDFLETLKSIKALELSVSETMLADSVCWQVGKIVFSLMNQLPNESAFKAKKIFEEILDLPFTRPSDGFSFLFKAFQKVFKDQDVYIRFADWWNFTNVRPEDYLKEKLPNGKEIMSVAEQAYIAYAKNLLPKDSPYGIEFSKDKAEEFLPRLDTIIESYPNYQYPPYFKAKLLLALGDKEDTMTAILPFARKKRNEFWVWQLLGETLNDNPALEFACYSKALSCKSPKEMLTKIRRKMACILIDKQLYNEAKTEINLLVQTIEEKGNKVPNEVIKWKTSDWYIKAKAVDSNFSFYKKYIRQAEIILYQDIEEEYVIIEHVNKDKQVANFIADETKIGFFKYGRLLKHIKVGDVLKVRFESGEHLGMFKVYTAERSDNNLFKEKFCKEVVGDLRIPAGKSFGFVEQVFVHPTVIKQRNLTNGVNVKGSAIKSFSQDKKQWGWKLI